MQQNNTLIFIIQEMGPVYLDPFVTPIVTVV